MSDDISVVNESTNMGIITLWVIVILSIIIVFIIIFLTIININTIISGGGNGPGNNIIQCSSLTEGLTDISSLPYCTAPQAGSLGKYDADLLMVLSPSPVWYQNVCSQFCSATYNYSNDTCIDGDPQSQQYVSNCLNSIKPINCNGLSKPVAISNGTLYYGLYASFNGC